MPHPPDDEPTPDAAEAQPEPEPPTGGAPTPMASADEPQGGMEPLPVRGTARPSPVADRDPPDPFAQAHEALARAAAARGAELTPIPAGRRHPLEAAEQALEKARAAREHAAAGGSRGQLREAEARAQLEALKRQGARPPGGSSPTPDAPPPAPTEKPKKRRL